MGIQLLLIIATFLATFLATLAVLPGVIRFLKAHTILDIPNARSSHDRPVPRGAGLGICAVFLVASTVLLLAGRPQAVERWLALVLAMTVLAVLGFLDDLYSLRVSTRLVVQGLVAAVAVWLGHLSMATLQFPLLPPLELGVLGHVLAWLWLFGFTNVFNFMDGIDGLAGFQAALAALALAVLEGIAGDHLFALLAVAMAGCSLGFLRHNFPRARVFLGDAGSLPAGFFLAFGVLHAARSVPGPMPFVLTSLIVWPFLFDGLFTLARRAFRGQRLSHPHREHLYQLLVRAGCSHSVVTAGYALVIVACAGFAVSMRLSGEGGPAIGFYGIVLLSLVAAVLVLRFHARRSAMSVTARRAGAQPGDAAGPKMTTRAGDRQLSRRVAGADAEESVPALRG